MSDGVTPPERKSETEASGANSLPLEIQSLMDRMAQGDRVAVAEFVRQVEPVILRRIRQKMGSKMRRVFDSEEALSSTRRRLDQMAARGKLRITGQEELRALILILAEHVVADLGAKATYILKGESSDIARQRSGMRADRDNLADRERSSDLLREAKPNEVDLAQCKARGIRLDVAAWLLGQSHDAAKQTWSRFSRRARQD